MKKHILFLAIQVTQLCNCFIHHAANSTAWLYVLAIGYRANCFILRYRWHFGLSVLILAAAGSFAAKEGKERMEAWRANFIAQWGPDIAAELDKEYEVPASIILAQAILESDWGRSKGARKHNAFFGIRANGRKSPFWNGKTHKNADGRARSYSTRKDSWYDHGWFLHDNPRYKPCFKCNKKSGKARAKCWAKKLHECGYCPKKRYPRQLIGIMDDYDLYRYDQD